jgi:hypothetical protein
MEEEIHALRENETYELAKLPESKNSVGGGGGGGGDGYMRLKLAPMEKRNTKPVM